MRILGELKVDWGRMRMNFMKEGQKVVLLGDTTLQITMVSLYSLKITKVEFCAALFYMSQSYGDKNKVGDTTGKKPKSCYSYY